MIQVIGDIIVDEFIWGDVSRISPEAPVPVVAVNRTDRRLGGSANVVRNLHSLNEASAMFGVIGADEPGRWVLQQLQELNSLTEGVLVKKNQRPTAIKSRVIARHQQVVRFDREWNHAIQPEVRSQLTTLVRNSLPQTRAVILSDYGKGVLTPDLIPVLIRALHGKIVAVDPIPKNADSYHGATLITPNLLEAATMTAMQPENSDAQAEAMARQLHKRLALQFVLITRAEKGMTLFDGSMIHHIPTAARDVFDVTGAGDTVIAVFTVCLARGDEPLVAAINANRAAGVVVGKVGTATASWQEINRQI